MITYAHLCFLCERARTQSVSTFRDSQHTLTQQREYMTKGTFSVCLCVIVCGCGMFERGKWRWTVCVFAYVCISEGDRLILWVCVCVSVCVQSLHILLLYRLCRTAWQCRTTDTYTSSVRVFAPDNTEKAHSNDQSTRITQGNVTT